MNVGYQKEILHSTSTLRISFSFFFGTKSSFCHSRRTGVSTCMQEEGCVHYERHTWQQLILLVSAKQKQQLKMQAYIVSAQLETVTFIVHPTLHFTKTGCGTDCSFVIFCFLPTVSLYGECRWYTLFIVEAHHTKFIKIISSDDRKTVFGCTRASDPVLQCANVLHIHI